MTLPPSEKRSAPGRRPRSRLAGALLAALVFSLPGLDAAQAEPALWRMADEDSTVWIFGSVHALPDDLEWRGEALDAILASVDRVYFEARTDVIAQIGLQSVIAEIGLNPPNRPLSSLLSAIGAARLLTVSQALGVNPAELELMRPWLAFMLISAQIAEASGADPDNGVDAALELSALEAGKTVDYFETLEQQTRFFADMDEDVQVRILEQTLEEYEVAGAMMDGLFSSWVAGDLETLESVVFASVETLPPSFFDVIFRRRNAAWAMELDRYMQGAGDALVVVGAGHMVGEDSLLDYLADAGWRVQRQ